MKVRSHVLRLSPSVGHGIAIMCAAVFVTSTPTMVRAAGVVGTGTAASCTDAALNAALAGGGLVTFNCGPAPVTIDISTGTGTKNTVADTTIDGGGLITISGGNSVGVFSVNAGVNFTVQNLTIANGMNATSGGAIHNFGALTVTNSALTGNRARFYGGAIFTNGMLTVTNSTFSANSAAGGGAIEILGDGTVATLTNSTFSGNRAPDMEGGAISNVGALTVTNSMFSDNGGNEGGAIFNNGMLTVTNSTFSENSALSNGGGAGGAISNYGGMLTMSNSTFSANIAAVGGAINSGGAVTVTNSTFSGNHAISAPGGAIFSNGFLGNNLLTVTNCTFSGNSDTFGASGLGRVTLTNTIVANSTVGGNCDASSVSIISDGGHNLDDGTTCGFSTANGSLSNTNPQLDPAGLRSNGGPTQTVALCTAVGVPAGCAAASPAINAGDQAICAAAPVNDLDQRGFVRPGTGHTTCSIGAYEADATGVAACIGDCSGTSTVAINDIITLVNIDLGNAEPSTCATGVPSGAEVNVAMIIQAVNNALNGCN